MKKCVDAFMAAALTYDEKKGVVVHNKDRCVGCWMCVMVCPYGAIRPDRGLRIPFVATYVPMKKSRCA